MLDFNIVGIIRRSRPRPRSDLSRADICGLGLRRHHGDVEYQHHGGNRERAQRCDPDGDGRRRHGRDTALSPDHMDRRQHRWRPYPQLHAGDTDTRLSLHPRGADDALHNNRRQSDYRIWRLRHKVPGAFRSSRRQPTMPADWSGASTLRRSAAGGGCPSRATGSVASGRAGLTAPIQKSSEDQAIRAGRLPPRVTTPAVFSSSAMRGPGATTSRITS